MINSKSKLVTLLLYLSVILGGSSIVFMLSIEYRQSNSLIEDNQILMHDIIIKTWQNNLHDKYANYPQNRQQVESNWRLIPPDVQIAFANEWIYPFRFTGNSSDKLSTLWKKYQQVIISEKSPTNSLTPSQQRVDALTKIKSAIDKQQTSQLPELTQNYFTLVENFPLSSLEEVISGIQLLSLGDQSRWNSELVNLYVLRGTPQLSSLSTYIIQHNDEFSAADLRKIIIEIKFILENSNIDDSWFLQQTTNLWKTFPSLNFKELRNYSILMPNQLFISNPQDLQLLLPFDITVELDTLQNSLKSQGILALSDQLILNQAGELTIYTLENLPFKIERISWREQAQQLYDFFIIKVFMAIIFMLSLGVVVTFVVYRSNKKLEFINLKEGFINLVSHELKTPLAAIRIMIETLQKRINKNLDPKDYPDRIIDEVDRLWLMLENLLSLNQIKSGELKLNLQPVNLNQLVRHVGQRFNDKTSDQLTLDIQIQDDLYVTVDPILFELIFVNLFSNAIKYCDKEFPTVTVAFAQSSNELLIYDNACGLQSTEWKKIFSDFYRANEQTTVKGTGIGLSLCRQIMEVHDGEIKVKQSSYQGTTWSIKLTNAAH